MSVLAPWLKATNVLEAMSGGAHAGLSARQADQRDAEMQLRAELEAQQQARITQDAAERLRYNYDALAQAREKALRDDAFRKDDHDAARLLKMDEMDALSQYREGVLKNQSDRTEGMKTIADLRAGRPFHVGGNLLQFNPETGSVKTLFSAPEKSVAPMVTGVPLDAKKPYGVKLNLRANDPLLNSLMGTNAAALGTNFVSPMPKLAPKAQAPGPISPALEPPVAAPSVVPQAEQPPKEAEVIRESARQKLITAPSKRKEILKRLIDAGISVEGL